MLTTTAPTAPLPIRRSAAKMQAAHSGTQTTAMRAVMAEKAS